MPSLQVRNLPEYIYRKLVEKATSEHRSIAQQTIVLPKKGTDTDHRSDSEIPSCNRSYKDTRPC